MALLAGARMALYDGLVTYDSDSVAVYSGQGRDMSVHSGRKRLMRPGDAGRAIGIKPSTLRVYVQHFADLLSDDAAARERPGYRLYSEQDVSILRQARELLDRGFTYERAAAELRSISQGSSPAAPTPRANNAAQRARSAGGADCQAQLAVLEQAVAAWRALAEERAAEVAELRDEVRELRSLLMADRRLQTVPRVRRR